VRCAGRIAAQPPFQRGLEACATAAAQAGFVDVFQQDFRPALEHGAQRAARLEMAGQHLVGEADGVIDAEPLGWPACQRRAGFDERGHFRHALQRHVRDRATIDEQRRTLLAHARAGAVIDKDLTVGPRFTPVDLQRLAQGFQNRRVAEHAVGDVVGNPHAVATARGRGKEVIELDHAMHLGQGQSQRFGDVIAHRRGDAAELGFNAAQDLHQLQRAAAMVIEDQVDLAVVLHGGFP